MDSSSGDIRLSNYLTVKAAEIRNSVDRYKRSSLEAHDAYLAAGRELAGVRRECERGQWAPFLAAVGIEARTARNMMKLARGGLDAATIGELGGVRAALETLRAGPAPCRDEAAPSPAARRRAARIAAGRCIECGAPLDGDRRRKCAGCRGRISRADKLLRKRAKLAAALASRLRAAVESGKGVQLTAREVRSMASQINDASAPAGGETTAAKAA